MSDVNLIYIGSKFYYDAMTDLSGKTLEQLANLIVDVEGKDDLKFMAIADEVLLTRNTPRDVWAEAYHRAMARLMGKHK